MDAKTFFRKVKNRLTDKIFALIHFRFLFRFFRYYMYKYMQKQFYDDWWDKKELPFFFKKEIDLYSWHYKAHCSSSKWCEQAVYARKEMFKNCVVLDLCTGDGFFPYYFYTDFAKRIDTVDFDKDAVAYAKKHYSQEKIRHFQKNIITEDLPSNDYDRVFWNTAIDYFSHDEQLLVLDKVIAASKKDMMLVGSVPKVAEGVRHSNNHNQQFSHKKDLEAVFSKKFKNYEIFHTDYNDEGIFYFKCWNPL